MSVFRTLRLLPALLAFGFVLATAAPAVAYACAMNDGAACCCGHNAGTVCPMDATSTEAPAPAEVPDSAEVCCAAHPATPLAERAVVPTPPTLDVPSPPVLWTLAPTRATPSAAAEYHLDTGPPPVRPHLAFAVLLI